MYDEIPLEKYRKVLAQIVGVSIWRLSESIVLRWDPSYFNHSVIKALDSIDSTEFKDQKGPVNISNNFYYKKENLLNYGTELKIKMNLEDIKNYFNVV